MVFVRNEMKKTYKPITNLKLGVKYPPSQFSGKKRMDFPQQGQHCTSPQTKRMKKEKFTLVVHYNIGPYKYFTYLPGDYRTVPFKLLLRAQFWINIFPVNLNTNCTERDVPYMVRLQQEFPWRIVFSSAVET